MSYLKPEEVKGLLTEGLVYFDSVCRKYGLRYFLAYGTLLGAVRHKGFIPWDDDIDVFMFRDDYERLLEHGREIESEDWKLLSCESEPRFLFRWAKLCNKKTVVVPSRFTNGFLYGASMDVFPLDTPSLSSDLKEAAEESALMLRKWRLRFASGAHQYAVGKGRGAKTFFRYAVGTVLFGSYTRNNRRFGRLMGQMYDDSAVCVSSMSESYLTMEKYVFKREWFTGTENREQRTEVFESRPFPVPLNCEKILETMYGDYMRLPPETERVSGHVGGCVWL